MDEIKPADATKICEDILRAERGYNVEHNILRSQNVIIDRLLARRIEVGDAYRVLCDRLSKRPAAVREFLDLLLCTAAFRNPQRSVDMRRVRERLKEVNRAIAAQGDALATLLDEREKLQEGTGFRDDTHYHVAQVIEAASVGNYHFQSQMKAKLQALRGQYGLKYWPRLGDMMRVLARDAGQAEVVAVDTITAASTRASRASQADFLKALFAAIEKNRGARWYELPAEFDLTDNAVAAFATVVLDLGPDDMMDAPYVKRLRQRERDVEKAAPARGAASMS